VDETIVLKTARMLVDTGLSKLGYRYVVPQDCMFSGRGGANSTLVEDPARWPSSLKGLSQQVHAMGLLFGSYTSASEFTCQWRQGSYSHEGEDSRNFCDQGLDFLWIDDCNGANCTAPKIALHISRTTPTHTHLLRTHLLSPLKGQPSPGAF
jgi:alpha-galactosidase